MKEKSKEREEQPLALHASRTFRAAAKREIGIDFEIARSASKKGSQMSHVSGNYLPCLACAVSFPKVIAENVAVLQPTPLTGVANKVDGKPFLALQSCLFLLHHCSPEHRDNQALSAHALFVSIGTVSGARMQFPPVLIIFNGPTSHDKKDLSAFQELVASCCFLLRRSS